MKKTLFGLTLFVALVLPLYAIQAAEQTGAVNEYTNPAGNPVDQFTGKYWLDSSATEKEAFLFGVDSAIAIEYFISARNADKNKKARTYTLSTFEKGWMHAFAHMTRKEIIKAVDDWYKAHPEELSRPVMGVLWYNVIVPRLNESASNK